MFNYGAISCVAGIVAPVDNGTVIFDLLIFYCVVGNCVELV
jgi:hypothetical protein